MKFWRNSGYWCSSLPLPPRLLFCIWQTRLDGSFHSWQTSASPWHWRRSLSLFTIQCRAAACSFRIHNTRRVLWEIRIRIRTIWRIYVAAIHSLVVKNLFSARTQHNTMHSDRWLTTVKREHFASFCRIKVVVERLRRSETFFSVSSVVSTHRTRSDVIDIERRTINPQKIPRDIFFTSLELKNMLMRNGRCSLR